jgi:hypothetical protein
MSDLAVFYLPDVVYRIAHDYPGGIPALAARMGKSPNVLNKKVAPDVESHHATLVDVLTIVDIADRDKRFVNALCANEGGVFVSTQHLDGVSDMALLETYTQLMAKFGEFSKSFNQALSDQRITQAEIKGIQQDMYAMNAAGAALITRLETLVDE